MGKEWLYWISGSGSGGGSGRGRPAARGGRKSGALEESDTSGGCMRAVLQLFDLNHQHQPPSDSSFLHGENILSRGVEAPRNSLESSMEAEENSTSALGIQIKTSRDRCRLSSSSSPRISCSVSKSRFDECSSVSGCNSPGTKTPSLVARLMGLDLLPDCTSPSLSSSSNSKTQLKSLLIHDRRMMRRSCYYDDDINVRSLPESPRMSSARRSDVECHRLSLQINKENVNHAFTASPEKMVIRKQAKEKTCRSRRVLHDITNINRSRDLGRRKEESEKISTHGESLLVLKPIKRNAENHHKVLSQDIISSGKSKTRRIVKAINKYPIICPSEKRLHGDQSISPSCSLELRRSDRMTTNSSRRLSTISPLMPKQEHQQKKNGGRDGRSTGKCSSSSLNQLTPRAYYDRPIRNNKKEAFFRPMESKGIKQSQVSDALSSERSTQLSSRTSHSYRQLNTDKISTAVPDRDNGCATTPAPASAAAAYRDYIRKILEHAAYFNNLTPSTLRLPLDPSIFLRLEQLHPTTTNSGGGGGVSTVLSHRCNRKLIFHLVDELLAEIPGTHFDLKRLFEELCKKVDRFPAANCQVLEDIDSLMNRDFDDSQLNRSFSKGGIVREIESEVLNFLVTETAAVVGGGTEEEQTERGRWERH